ncbi:short-chain dehydrogenase/reductase [Vairimorpha necatrix]|uniref:Short-chain dehydrogenase/reductase n=1 Tax=Vairimorpha necatrix TaxID=6039 RepID=A0AAX4JE93_9MICR
MILTNKTVCITAGNKGLGGEIVKLLLEKCKKIIIIDRSDQITFHDKIHYIQMDISKELPPVQDCDIFISNLGLSLGQKLVKDMTYEEMEKMIYVNIKLQLWFYKNYKYKKFVFINSVMSFIGLEKYSFYSASKAFIRILNQSLIREKCDTLIVYPYKINTLMFKEVKDFWTLEASKVAESVIYGIENDKKEIWLPWIFRYTEALLGFLPRFVSYWIMDLIVKSFYKKEKEN